LLNYLIPVLNLSLTTFRYLYPFFVTDPSLILLNLTVALLTLSSFPFIPGEDSLPEETDPYWLGRKLQCSRENVLIRYNSTCVRYGPDLPLKNNNRYIRALFQRDIVSRPALVSFWNGCVDGLLWSKIWKLPHKYLITNKIKEISFKLIYKYYPCKYYLVNRFNFDIEIFCTFCGLHAETYHLFWSCPHLVCFWSDFCPFMKAHIMPSFELCFKNVLFVFSPITNVILRNII